MNLFNGGKDYLAVQMAKKGEMIADLDRQALGNLLIARVITSFYDAFAAGEFVKIAEKSVQTISEHLRMMQVRLEGGGALKSDVLSLEVRLARAKEQLLSSKNHYEIALASLFNLMGLDSGFIDDDTEALEKSFLETPLLPETFTDGFVHALKQRPEIASIRRKLVQSRMEVDSAKSSYLPSLDLMMKYYVADPEMKYNLDRENWIAAVILNWDFFSGFATQASVRRAESALKEMLAADQKQLLKIRLDVKTAYLNRQEAESRYHVAINAVDSAAESFRIVKNHYMGGSVPVTRFLEAELDLNKARIHAAVANYDREKASAEIARAIGLWSSQTIFPK
jgi:outer membrane protein TolC